MRSWFLLLLLACSLTFVRLANAQEFPGVNTRRFQPSTSPSGSLYLEPTQTPGPGVWSAGAWLVYSLHPDVLRDINGVAVAKMVSHQLSTDLVGSVGIGQKIAVGLDVPLVLYQTGDENEISTAVAGGKPPAQALGDIALTAKGNLMSPGDIGGFGLAALMRLTVPSGDASSYLGEGMPTGELRMLGEYRIVAFALQATAGIKLRAEQREVLNRTYQNEVPWGVAFVVRPQIFGWDAKGRLTWVAEVHGSATLAAGDDTTGVRPASAAMLGLSSRMAIGDMSVLLGVETSLTEAWGGAPLQVVAGAQWMPRSRDKDHDGVNDEADQCPELAEDRDGVQDADGCPDFEDHDDDGVPDGDDLCPNDKEDQDGYEDADGCAELDNDEDGIPDPLDACPNYEGEAREDANTTGCPDTDGDGKVDKIDKCPGKPEDVDGFEDADGCPDPDNDGDEVPDADDACPNVSAGPTPGWRLGCPLTDRDGDTIEDSADKCPDEPETFNGVNDEDGCADTGGRPLVVVQQNGNDRALRFARPLKFKGSREAPEIDPSSVPTLRALALELNRHPNWIVAIGVRPKSESTFDQQAALSQAFVVVETVRGFGTRDGLAETIGWRAVSNQPGVWANGFGALLFVQVDASPPASPPPGAPPSGAPPDPAAPAAPAAPGSAPSSSTPSSAAPGAASSGGSPAGGLPPGSAGSAAPAPPSSGAPPKVEAPPQP
jgi:OOP family OmpA-OmpF porin